ncbi:Hypothetical protein ING2D1G_0292 [Peptoniphilus sp. ING2-D1G]|nr:Hypothetical protein ING2D1G_0292 [Peptoniphilus sp. ING2-D1G]
MAAQGYEFERWSPAIPEDATEVATTEYKAEFLQQYEVVFDSHYGTAVDSVTVNHGDILSLPNDPTRTGNGVDYIFGGWYTDWLRTVPFDRELPITHDMTLHAKWNMVGGYSSQQNAVASRVKNTITSLVNVQQGKGAILLDEENREGIIKICDTNAKVKDSFTMKSLSQIDQLNILKDFWDDGFREVRIGSGPWRVMPKPTIFAATKLIKFGENLTGDIEAVGFDLSNEDMTMRELLGKELKIQIKTLDGRIDEYNINTVEGTDC